MTEGEKLSLLKLAELWRAKANRIRDKWTGYSGEVVASAIETCAEEVEQQVKEFEK